MQAGEGMEADASCWLCAPLPPVRLLPLSSTEATEGALQDDSGRRPACSVKWRHFTAPMA